MTSDNGFIDLRLNAQGGQNQESFWPSFTDIMTVIVMIFMIAMVVLLLRNMELVVKLRATMAAERSAMELARSTGIEKEGLSLRLIAAENEISRRRMEQLKLDETNRRQKQALQDQAEEITALQTTNSALTVKRQQLEGENKVLAERLIRADQRAQTLQEGQRNLQQDLAAAREQLERSQRQLSSIQQDVASLKRLQEEAERQYQALAERYSAQAQELLETKSAMRRSGFQLNALQGEYDALQIKYNELFRPARSAEGRFLVEVRYYKVDGEPRIEYAAGIDDRFARISRSELEKRLATLKRERPEGLYIKVIFPEESGLTYNEAWRFTSELHARYDYYSQEKVLVPAAPDDTR